jgi:hypothetical protein
MLLDSNILIYGGKTHHPGLDAILARTDLTTTTVSQIEFKGRVCLVEQLFYFLGVFRGRLAGHS